MYLKRLDNTCVKSASQSFIFEPALKDKSCKCDFVSLCKARLRKRYVWSNLIIYINDVQMNSYHFRTFRRTIPPRTHTQSHSQGQYNHHGCKEKTRIHQCLNKNKTNLSMKRFDKFYGRK